MVSIVLFLATFMVSEGFGFQYHMTHSVPKLEDFVWFEEPDFGRFQPHENSKVTEVPKVIEVTKVKEVKETVTEENPWETDDEKFAEYFFATKWK